MFIWLSPEYFIFFGILFKRDDNLIYIELNPFAVYMSKTPVEIFTCMNFPREMFTYTIPFLVCFINTIYLLQI